MVIRFTEISLVSNRHMALARAGGEGCRENRGWCDKRAPQDMGLGVCGAVKGSSTL